MASQLFKSTLLNRRSVKIINKPNPEILEYIKLLRSAYSDEWLAVYQYSIEADFLNKLNYQNKLSDKAFNQITKELNIHTQEEFNHAKLIIPELIRLDSEPVNNIDSLSSNANGPFLVPEYDHEIILNQAIDAEAGAIKVYSELVKFTNDKLVTNQKFQDTLKFILEQEREHKSDLEKLLKEFKGGIK